MYNGTPENTGNKIWQTGSVDSDVAYNGKHFMTIMNNGYLRIWGGVGAYDNQGLFWNEYIGTDISGYSQLGINLSLKDNKNLAFISGSTTDFINKWQADRTTLVSKAYIREGQFLSAFNQTYFLALEKNGNFCLYGGSDPAHNTGLLWQSGVTSTVGNYFAIMQDDGNFCIYKETEPSNNLGFLWSTQGMADNRYFRVLQDNNIYKLVLSKPVSFNSYNTLSENINVVKKIAQNTSLSAFRNGVTAGSNLLTFKDKSFIIISNENTKTATGIIAQIDNGQTVTDYTMILYGDVNGDGLISAFDLAMVKNIF